MMGMPSRFVVTAFHGETSEKVGEFTDAVKLALAMWELGLQRPEFDSIQVQELPVREENKVTITDPTMYLIRRFGCSVEEAHKALENSKGSVIHAAVLLEEVRLYGAEKRPETQD